jgi:hypothetical protein
MGLIKQFGENNLFILLPGDRFGETGATRRCAAIARVGCPNRQRRGHAGAFAPGSLNKF